MDSQPARQRGSALPVVVRPEFQCFVCRFYCQHFSGCDVYRVKCPDIHSKGAFCMVDHGSIDWGKIEHGEQICQFFSLAGRLCIIEIAEQAFATDRSERLDLQELGGYDADSCGERNGRPQF